MAQSAISVVLLPDKSDYKRLVAASADIARQTKSMIQLSDASLPHVTVALFDAPDEACAELWSQIKQYKHSYELQSRGIELYPDRDNNMVWMVTSFVQAAAIVQLQADICRTDFAKQYQVLNQTGDAFNMHCTMALFPGLTLPSLELTDLELYKKDYRNLSLAVGVNGEYYTFIESRFP